jgi:F0F1-type ATP synthase alpha subunit
MKYSAEMGSGAMIYIPSFIKIGSGIRKLIRGDAQTGSRSHKPALGK